MLHMLWGYLKLHQGKEKFLPYMWLLFNYDPEGYALIERAYECVENEFQHKNRDVGGKYLEHLEAAALIACWLQFREGKRDAKLIAAALLHDIIEDIPGWTEERLAKTFTPEVAQCVKRVTKPPRKKFGGSRALRNKAYAAQLREAPRAAVMVKIADQLDNFITLWVKPTQKQKVKLEFARSVLLPLAEKYQVAPMYLNFAIMDAETKLNIQSVMKSTLEQFRSVDSE